MSRNQDQQQSTSTTTYTMDGVEYTTVTNTPLPPDTTPKPTTGNQQRFYAEKYGFYKALLKAYPELADLVARAMKAYEQDGQGWTEERFWAEYNKTQFAQERTKAEEEFDIAMAGPNADTYQKAIEDRAAAIRQELGRLGITVSDEEVMAQARAMERSKLPNEAMSAWISNKYLSGSDPTTGGTAKVGQGTASTIQSQLSTMAANYGLSMNDDLLRQKTGQALAQGERWQEWVNGQEDYYRQQAKMLFPGAADLLDSMTLKDIAEPYFQTAYSVLGELPTSMSLTDPKWTAFLQGPNGRLSRDEWARVLKTDAQYGWDKSLKARTEFASLGDELLSAFGMA